MTVTYTAEVATCRGFGCFLKLLRRWRGSIYKLVWLDLCVFLGAYYSLNFMYRFLLDERGKHMFENVVKYCYDYNTLIPLSFVLGFYVTVVMTRWWNQYISIPFPDPLAVFVSATIHGQDERGRVMRRTIMRYVCLCVTMMFTMISPRVKKRFPSLEHFVEAGLLQESEKDIIASLNKKFPKYSKHWLPIVWASSIITRARKEGRIRDDFAVKTMIDELNKFRGKCGLLISYDTISVPLVYTQVVTLAVYSYFLTTLMGNQWVEGNKYKFDLYFPVFSTLQFFFYMGWLKVAETLINPFGDDDDDFDLNWMIDRNLQVSYLIVDEMHHEHPELVRDQYWDEVFPQELPYTLASEPFREEHPQPSTANINVKPLGATITTHPSSIKIDGLQSYNDINSAITFTAKPSSVNLSKRGSQNSIATTTTVPDSIPRNNSVTNVLKRLFSKEDQKISDKTPETKAIELVQKNLTPPSKSTPGSMKIINQVIEEVDEQLTITSQKGANESRPSVMNLFGPPAPSKPIDMPKNNKSSADPKEYISASAPDKTLTPEDVDSISIGGSLTDNDNDEEDEFTKLKNIRQEEKQSRLKLNLIRSLSCNPGDSGETDYLLKRRSSGMSGRSSDKSPKPYEGSSETDLLFFEKKPTIKKSTDNNPKKN